MERDTLIRRLCIVRLGVPLNELRTVCKYLFEQERIWDFLHCDAGQVRPDTNQLACAEVVRDWIYNSRPVNNLWILPELAFWGIMSAAVFSLFFHLLFP